MCREGGRREIPGFPPVQLDIPVFPPVQLDIPPLYREGAKQGRGSSSSQHSQINFVKNYQILEPSNLVKVEGQQISLKKVRESNTCLYNYIAVSSGSDTEHVLKSAELNPNNSISYKDDPDCDEQED